MASPSIESDLGSGPNVRERERVLLQREPNRRSRRREVHREEEALQDVPTAINIAAAEGAATSQRRRYQTFIEEVSEHEEEHGPSYTDLPPEEDDVRLRTRAESLITRRSSGIRIIGRRGSRGGDGPFDDVDELPSDGDSQPLVRLRGGVAHFGRPTRMSSIAAGTLPGQGINTQTRRIE